MQTKLTLPLVMISILAAIAFGWQWVRENQRTYNLTITTGGKDGEYHAFATALAQVVTQHEPQIKISVIESAGSQENMERLGRGEVELAIVQSDTPVQPSARAVAYLFPEVFHLIALENSGIQEVADLRGRRVALMPEGSGSYDLFWKMSQHYGMEAEDLQTLPLPPDQAIAKLKAGEVDAFFRVIAVGSGAIADLLRTTPAQLISIDQVEAMQLSLPYLEATTIPKGTYDGGAPIPPNPLPVVGVRAILITHADVDEKVIQQITQTLFEFRNELVAIYPKAANLRLPDANANLGMPLHPGAKSYYDQDRPSFVVEYAEPIGLLISVSLLCASGAWQFRSWLLERQKNRADMYNLEILGLVNQVQDSENLEELQLVRAKLFEILHKVVTDLDQDRISSESFQSFAFPWEVAVNSIRHREVVLRNMPISPLPSNPSAAESTVIQGTVE